MSKPVKIAVLPGDGIGPEVTAQAVRVLDAVAKKFGHQFSYTYGLIGAEAIDKSGDPLPTETLQICKSSNAVLLGAVGHPRFDNDPGSRLRPEQGLLRIRKELGLFANIRPVKAYAALQHLAPLKSQLLENVDIVIYRELTGGIYFGNKETSEDGHTASDQCIYTSKEISRITELAFKHAATRKGKLTLVDKANVLETSRLWRKKVTEIATEYPHVEFECLFVDNAAMQLVLQPSRFDVILTENMFGDILSDVASVLPGSLGLLPSASIGSGTALFEPVHGSYPQAAGKDIANPVGAILSAAMLLDHLGMKEEAMEINSAVNWTIQHGFVTKDIDPVNFYFTSTIGEVIADIIANNTVEGIHLHNIQMRKSTII
jgi:3-isopropylmalate dehydrogenase